MDITYLGGTQFKLKTKIGSVTTHDSALVIAHKTADLADFNIAAPGEYEVEGISVFGYQTEEGTVYVIQAEDLRILYLGQIAKPLTEKLVTELENIDVVELDAHTEPGDRDWNALAPGDTECRDAAARLHQRCRGRERDDGDGQSGRKRIDRSDLPSQSMYFSAQQNMKTSSLLERTWLLSTISCFCA
mgnify:CR=1 FL=1